MTEEYSIWLMPAGLVYRDFAKIISGLSKKYSTPNFEPHVTLIGKLQGNEKDIIDKTRKLEKEILPYVINTKNVGYSDEYFKCLFLRVEQTRNEMEANLKAREIFSRQEEYSPHLSLMYGNLASEVKNSIIQEIGTDFNLTFRVAQLHLFLTTGYVEHWRKIDI